MSMHLHQWAPGAKTMPQPTLPNAFVPPKDTIYDHLYIWTPSTVLGPVYDNDYPLDIFITPWQTSSSAELEREMQNAKVAPQCWWGTSEFCVEIISLFSCHLGSGCWRVAWARCFMGNTTERHLQQMLMGRAGHLGTDLESTNLSRNLKLNHRRKLQTGLIWGQFWGRFKRAHLKGFLSNYKNLSRKMQWSLHEEKSQLYESDKNNSATLQCNPSKNPWNCILLTPESW